MPTEWKVSKIVIRSVESKLDAKLRMRSFSSQLNLICELDPKLNKYSTDKLSQDKLLMVHSDLFIYFQC